MAGDLAANLEYKNKGYILKRWKQRPKRSNTGLLMKLLLERTEVFIYKDIRVL